MNNWQPIETAPKDRTILVYGTWMSETSSREEVVDNPEIFMVEYQYGEWTIVGGIHYATFVHKPSHWMELPEPPANGDEK